MSDFTPRANLRLPGGGSTGTILPDEQVDIDVLNDNFRKIDALLGARNIPSVSSYSGSMDGDLVYARDTNFLHMFSANAGGLITPKLPGSNMYRGAKAVREADVLKYAKGDIWKDIDDKELIYEHTGTAWREYLSPRVWRHLFYATQESGALANAWTDVPALTFTHTSTRPSKFRLSVTGRGVNGTSGAYRTFGVRLIVDGVAPNPVGELTTIDYPASGAWASAVSERIVTAELPAGSHTFKVAAMASAASAVVPKFFFEVEEMVV